MATISKTVGVSAFILCFGLSMPMPRTLRPKHTHRMIEGPRVNKR